MKTCLTLAIHLLLLSGLSAAIYPALPQVFIQTAYDPPSTGQVFSVNTNAGFQSALNTAQLGDIIELQAGTTFTGPFTLPNKTSGTGWIYIRSSAYSSLPSPCSRVSPADAANMPKIVVIAGSGGAVNTVSGAHNYRFVGIEFKPVAGNFVYNIVSIGNGETSAATLPHHIVIDRCYIHGDPAAGSRRGVLMNGAYVSVIDSYVSDCKEDGADSQAIASYSTTGPLKIVNNYLEGAGENVIFGGADPSIPNAVPSDIEIRCNLFFKPLSWMNEAWDIKNLLEFKNARRVLVEGNRFENCWPNAQNGFALLLTPRNQNNTAPWSAVQDITIRLNIFVNIAQGVNLSGFDAPNMSQRTSRVLIQNNVLNVNNLGMGGDGRLFQILNGSTDVIIDHNTGFCTNAYLVADGTPKTDFFVFSNNLVNHANYGFIGTGTAYANTTLAAFFNPNWVVTHNADIGGSSTNYPVGNYFPTNINAVGFVNYSGGDYHLNANSTFNNLGTDGKDLGADIDSIAIASTYNCKSAFSNVSIKFPDDKFLTNCVLDANYGQPILHNPDSLNLLVTYYDEIIDVVPDACFRIERVWTVSNPDFIDSSQTCIFIPNPGPNPIVNNAVNLPGPTVSSAGTTPPWASTIVKISPVDTAATDYSKFWSAHANCYQYKQTIKIIDTQKPVVQNCMAPPLILNDSTQNDPEFWNAPYWPNPFASGNDLDESTADLSITATDSCGWPKVRYLLFMDLNNDGVKETVINSSAPPPPGYVYFNNLGNPNYSGGELRKFDQRPVPDSSLFQFGLFVSHDNLNVSASVQWNTQQNFALNKAPEIPAGDHYIKWFVEDVCGNETICERYFSITNQTTATRLPTGTGGFLMFQNSPNPFSEETMIRFQTPETGVINLELRDVTGRLIFSKTEQYAAGIQTITLGQAELHDAKGLIFCLLRSERYVAVTSLLRM